MTVLEDAFPRTCDTLEFAAGAFSTDGWMLSGTNDHATSIRRGRTNPYNAEQEFFMPTDATCLRSPFATWLQAT